MDVQEKFGFTLLELAIVLIIVGLLAAGILVGRTLIRAAELRKVHSQFTEFMTVANTFKAKYNCLPGDCAHATDFFPAFDTGGACPPYDASPATATCNGDGDDRINSQNGNPTEAVLFWQHLADAALIPGVYSGSWEVSVPSTWGQVAGRDCPPVLDNSFCWIIDDAGVTLTPTFSLPYLLSGYTLETTYLYLYPMASNQNVYDMQFFQPTEMQMFDVKYDDGNPLTGGIVSIANNGCTVGSRRNWTYKTTITASSCTPFFVVSF